jgi:hypothetical protein
LWLFNFYNQKNSLHKAGNPLECSRSKALIAWTMANGAIILLAFASE